MYSTEMDKRRLVGETKYQKQDQRRSSSVNRESTATDDILSRLTKTSLNKFKSSNEFLYKIVLAVIERRQVHPQAIEHVNRIYCNRPVFLLLSFLNQVLV